MKEEKWKHIETGEIEVAHKGLRRPLPQKVWAGPKVLATVVRSSQVLWEDYVPQCNNCLGYGHLSLFCNKERRCRRCRKTGHEGKECSKCARCKKWGHRTEDCYFDPENRKKKETSLQEKIRAVKETVQTIMQNPHQDSAGQNGTLEKERKDKG